MTDTQLTAGHSWGAVADGVARRVNRRTRVGAVLRRLNVALLATGVAAVGFRALSTGAIDRDRAVVAGLFGAGLLLGLGWGLRAARRVKPVASADAAWALDRLAGARGRGLAAAAADGPAAAEAAWSQAAIAPPERVTLHPPRGLVVTVAALGLFALAALVPARGASAPEERTVVRIVGEGGGGAAEDAEAEAAALDARAEDARRLRRLLNLPADGPLDPAEVAERLADAAVRRKAAAAAAPGTPLSEVLDGGDTSGEALARLLAASDADPAAASQRRREAASARARTGAVPVPPGRRDVVTRYLTRLSDEGLK